jgi:hypothetical protein
VTAATAGPLCLEGDPLLGLLALLGQAADARPPAKLAKPNTGESRTLHLRPSGDCRAPAVASDDLPRDICAGCDCCLNCNQRDYHQESITRA